MMQETKIGLIGVVLIILLTGFFSFNFNQIKTKLGSSAKTNLKSNNGLILSTQEIAKHNIQSDCWIIINNKVYEITGYIDIHPGGKGLVSYCGLDASQGFTTKGGKGSHSQDAINQLNNLYIGNLNGEINNQNNIQKNIDNIRKNFKTKDDDD